MYLFVYIFLRVDGRKGNVYNVYNNDDNNSNKKKWIF